MARKGGGRKGGREEGREGGRKGGREEKEGGKGREGEGWRKEK